MSPEEQEVAEAVEREFDYLAGLREAGRTADLVSRVRRLRDHGWEMRNLAAGIGMSRQRLYQLLDENPEQKAPADSPQILDMRTPSDLGLRFRYDTIEVPPPLCDPLRALWAVAFRDKTAGTSPVSVTLDVTILLLNRRGVPLVRIAACGNVTHRAVSERLRRASERDTLPAELMSSFLSQTRRSLKTTAEIDDPRRRFALVQVASASRSPRFYTLRSDADRLLMFDPYRPPKRLIDARLTDFTVITDERRWVDVISSIETDPDSLFAIPVQWLYTSSVPPSVWHRAAYNINDRFFPPGLEPVDPQVRQCFTDPRKVLTRIKPIRWGGQS